MFADYAVLLLQYCTKNLEYVSHYIPGGKIVIYRKVVAKKYIQAILGAKVPSIFRVNLETLPNT